MNRQIRQKNRKPDGLRRKDDAAETIYGLHSAFAALANPERHIHSIHMTRNVADKQASKVADIKAEIRIIHPRELDRICGAGAVHQGIAITCSPLPVPGIDDIDVSGPVLLLDQVSDPHNTGAILRSAAAFGATAVICTERRSAAMSGVLAKAASGAVEHVPLVPVTNLARAMRDLKDRGVGLVGLDSQAGMPIADAPDYSPCGLVLGAEGRGLRRLTTETCDCLARLDLPGPIKSLNVSNAAVLALHIMTVKQQKNRPG